MKRTKSRFYIFFISVRGYINNWWYLLPTTLKVIFIYFLHGLTRQSRGHIYYFVLRVRNRSEKYFEEKNTVDTCVGDAGIGDVFLM